MHNSPIRTRHLIAGAAALLMSGLNLSAAVAADRAAVPSAAGSSGNAQERAGRRICFRSETTGSVISRLVCRTRAEWLRTYGAVPGDR